VKLVINIGKPCRSFTFNGVWSFIGNEKLHSSKFLDAIDLLRARHRGMIKWDHRSPTQSVCVTDVICLIFGKFCPFASEVVFPAILKDFEFAVPLNRRTRVESIFERLQHWRDFPSENHIAPPSNLAAESLKHPPLFLYLPIKDPSKRPRTRPRRKLKFQSFGTVKMHSKIYVCQPETVPLIASF